MSQPKIKDVARAAGVSTATVSHVINKTRYVSEETTVRVLQAMEELNYRPNHAARSLRSAKTYTIGLIIPFRKEDTSKSFFMSIAEGIEETLREYGYHLIISNSKEDLKQEIEQLQLLNDQITDGIILASTYSEYQTLEKHILKDHPLVLIDRIPEENQRDSVSIDSYQGVYDAIKYLKKKGYKRIGYAGANLTISTAKQRLAGYQDAQKDEPDVENIVFIGEPTYESGYEMAAQLLLHDLDAIFIANNEVATGIIYYFIENKITIPDDIAVIVFDNFKWTRIVSPPLTVVDQPAYEMGIEAAHMILSRIQSPDKKMKKVVLQPMLIERGST
ncbi:LacI family DNA-binding transcriptional regulator [Oceanobacillus alkalisoli]|uniref:LacI family DNA-binding transcriptional regulator n=1 Tax=Oceanobacillus alkalisoli TaxID=2925113 RepID=UPI001EE3E41A|nr:LacI family DNA-binding transcriptional regulator [Oceanobacillus alkalisoli]MCG5102497.1 LacI family transcriptional regulator [Oceanobacillus alkalisoli]